MHFSIEMQTPILAPKKMKKRKFKPETVAEAINDAGGILINAARTLRCNRRTVYDYSITA